MSSSMSLYRGPGGLKACLIDSLVMPNKYFVSSNTKSATFISVFSLSALRNESMTGCSLLVSDSSSDEGGGEQVNRTLSVL